MTSSKRAFTLVELLVVLAMVALILAAMTTGVTGAMERARVQKATSEVKIIAQAILAYENETKNGHDYELPTMEKVDCDRDSIGFLLGKETSQSGQVPVLLMASLANGGKMLDPWGHPYKVTIKKSSNSVNFESMRQNLRTGFTMPNAYRLGEGER